MNDRRPEHGDVDEAMKYDGDDRRAPERWKVKKEVSLADILSFVSAALAVVYAYTTLDKRVFSLEQSASVQANTDRRQDDDANRSQGRIEARFDSIEKKLDRLIERR